MPTFIKPGYWNNKKNKLAGELNLNELIQKNLPVTTTTTTTTVVPVKQYIANITQIGTNPPVATVQKNTLGGPVIWSYQTVGQYGFTIPGVTNSADYSVIVIPNSSVNQDFTLINVFKNNTAGGLMTFDGTNIGFTSYFSKSNDVLFNTTIQIRVYN